MKKSIIVIALALLAIIIIVIPLTSNDDYKELNDIVNKISEVRISKIKKEEFRDGFKYQENDKEHKVHYYGIDSVEFVINKNEFAMQKLFKEKILTHDILQEYLDNEYNKGNIKREVMRDGETSIYTEDNYSVVICNTLEGNKDIYFGIKDMSLKDNFCD